MFSGLFQHRRVPTSIVVMFCFVLIPRLTTGQTSTKHPRLELGGGTGVTTLGGDLFHKSTSGVELSTYVSYHAGAGILLRATAALSAVGDIGEDVGTPDADGRGLLEKAGFDLLLLSVGPVIRFSPPASLVAGHMGARLIRLEPITGSVDNAWGGGLTGGMTFWLNDWFAVDSGISATLLRRRITDPGDGTSNSGWATGRIITGMLALVVAFK